MHLSFAPGAEQAIQNSLEVADKGAQHQALMLCSKAALWFYVAA